MKRQSNESIASRVFSYGTVPERIAPVMGEEAALAQLRLANRLWNTLVAIERARIARYRLIMHDEQQERIEQLQQKKTALREEMKARRKEARKRKAVDLSDLKTELESTHAELVAAIQSHKQTTAARHEARRAELSANAERTHRRIKRARQAAASMGLFWGTYNDIVQRADAGRKHGGELHFRSFRGEGTLTAQIMGGAGVDHCLSGGHTFFQVDPPAAGRKWRYARMRIGSNPDRSPVWLAIPIVLHRDLPPMADIRSVSMTRRLMAGRAANRPDMRAFIVDVEELIMWKSTGVDELERLYKL